MNETEKKEQDKNINNESIGNVHSEDFMNGEEWHPYNLLQIALKFKNHVLETNKKQRN